MSQSRRSVNSAWDDQPPFVMLPTGAYARLADLEKSDIAVLIVLCSNRDFKTNLVSLGQRYIIDRAGLSDERLVRDSVARLEALELITTIRAATAGRGGRAVWRINYEPPETPDPVRHSGGDDSPRTMPESVRRNEYGINEEYRNDSGVSGASAVEMPELMPEQIPEPLRHVSESEPKEEKKQASSLSPPGPAAKSEKSRRVGVVDRRSNDPAVIAIYNAYPRKVGRGFAVKAIVVALRNLERKAPTAANGEAWESWLLGRVVAYAEARKRALAASPRDGPHFTPHPGTWFNEQRFDDDPAEWEPHARGSQNGSQHPRTHQPGRLVASRRPPTLNPEPG